MLAQKTELSSSGNTQTSFSVSVSPSNRVQFILKPLYEFHRQVGESEYRFVKSTEISLLTIYMMAFEQLFRLRSERLLEFMFWRLLDFYGFIVDSYLQIPGSETDQALCDFLASHLNCKQVEKHGEEKSPRPKKFTRKGRQTILDAGGALEKEGYKPQDFYFFTGTLPGGTIPAMKGLADNSRRIVNDMKTKLRKEWGTDITFNSWEWQKRGALHLHLVIYAPGLCKPKDLKDWLQTTWLDWMDRITEEGVDMYERESRGGLRWHRDSQSVQENCCKTIQCEKSVAAYLSKYVGKESLTADKQMVGFTKNNKNNRFFYPSSWWSISNKLRDLIKKHSCIFSVTLSQDKAVEAWADVFSLVQGASVLTLGVFSPEGFPDYVYQSMYIKPEFYDDIQCFLAATFCDPAYQSEDTGFASIMSLGKAAVFWLHLPKNTFRLLDFYYKLPRYMKHGNKKVEDIDWTQGWAIRRAVKYFQEYLLSNPWDSLLAFQ